MRGLWAIYIAPMAKAALRETNAFKRRNLFLTSRNGIRAFLLLLPTVT